MLRDVEVLEAIKQDNLAYILLLRSEKLLTLLPAEDTPEMLLHRPTTLQVSAFYGAEKCYFYLKSLPLYTKIENKDIPTVLFAAAGGNIHILSSILENSNQVDLVDTNGNTALHYAIKFSHLQATNLLLEKGSSLEVCDKNGFTAAHFAAANGRLDILKLLYEHGDHMKEINAVGWCPLIYAIKNNHKEAALFMIEKKCLDTSVDTFVSLTQLAASLNMNDVVQALLDYGINVNDANHNFWGLVHFAAAAGGTFLIRYIYDTYKTEPFTMLDRLDRSAAHIAAINGHLDVLKEIESLGMNMYELQDKQGNTPFFYACEFGHKHIVEYLISKTNLETRDKLGQNALILSVVNGRNDIAKILIDNNININATDLQGKTALVHAIETNNIDLVNMLYDAGCDASILPNNKRPLLASAILTKNRDLISLLLEKGSDPTLKDGRGWTVLHFAAQTGALNALSIFIDDERTKPLFTAQNADGQTPFMVAVFWGKNDVANFLIDKQMDYCNIQDTNGNSALHYACKLNHTIIAYMIIEHPEADLNLQNKEGDTPLLVAINSWSTEIIVKLIETFRCHVNLSNNKRLTPLLLAAKMGQQETVELLISKPRVRCDVLSQAGMNAANYAAKQNDFALLSILHKNGRVDMKRDFHGLNPLEILKSQPSYYYSDDNYSSYDEEESYDEEDYYDYDDPDQPDVPIFLNSGDVYLSRTKDHLFSEMPMKPKPSLSMETMAELHQNI